MQVYAPNASVTFDGIAATDVELLSPTSIKATTPAHPSGRVDVVATVNGTPTTITKGFAYGTAPVVTMHPETLTLTPSDPIDDGSEVTFSSTATGDDEPTAQWQKSIDNGKTWTDIASKQRTTGLTVAVTTDNVGVQYRAVFTNGLGQAISDPATIVAQHIKPTQPSVTTPGGAAGTENSANAENSGGGIAVTGPVGLALMAVVALLALGSGLVLFRVVRARRSLQS